MCNHVNIHVISFFIYVLIILMFVLWCCYLYLIVIYWCILFIWIPRKKIAKKETSQVQFVISFFGMNVVIFRVHFFLSVHVVDFIFWVCISWIWNNRVAQDYFFTISLKRGSVKILAWSSISPESQTKSKFKVTASR